MMDMMQQVMGLQVGKRPKKEFITDFQRLGVIVTDISESRLIMLFVEELLEPLHGYVRTYKPTSLHDFISRAQDMIDVVPNKRAFVPMRPTTQ